MSTLFALVAAVFNAVLVAAAAARRLLGVPVRWPRSLLFAVRMSAAVTWPIEYLGRRPACSPPGARRQVSADVEIILRLARRLERATAWGRSLGVVRLAQGFAASLEEELDYRVELDNQRSVAATLGRGVVVPAVHEQLSGGQLLVMDRLDGVPVGDAAALLARFAPAASTRNTLGLLLVAAGLRGRFEQ